MEIQLNPRNENFKELLNNEIFVDKTTFLSAFNKLLKGSNKYIFLLQEDLEKVFWVQRLILFSLAKKNFL